MAVAPEASPRLFSSSNLDDQDEVTDGDEGEPCSDEQIQHAHHVVASGLTGADGAQAVDDPARDDVTHVTLRHTCHSSRTSWCTRHVMHGSHGMQSQRDPGLDKTSGVAGSCRQIAVHPGPY